MTNEELLKTRYIIIADWPQSNINPFHVGDILVELSIYFTREKNPKSIHREEIVKYPHLFRKLEFWEERKEEDMPLYLKDGDKEVLKVLRHFRDKIMPRPDCFTCHGQYGIWVEFYSNYLPATEEEYSQYTQKK